MDTVAVRRERRWDLAVFLFVTFVAIPLATIGFVAAYGFVVWFWQIFTGPPGT
jgi:nitrate reductase NapE